MTAILSAPSRRRIPEPSPPSLTFASGPYQIVARCGERTARAVRTLHGWQIGLRPRLPERDPCSYCGEFHRVYPRLRWLAVDTRDGAELALTRLLLFGSAS